MKTDVSLTELCFGLLMGTFVFALVATWPIMIALGVLHVYFHGVPAFGFLAVMVMLWAADLLGRVVLGGHR